jgi:hypothetical protein
VHPNLAQLADKNGSNVADNPAKTWGLPIEYPVTPADFLSNPSVHSLLVTLGNHAVHDFQTYNWPCPVGHLPI